MIGSDRTGAGGVELGGAGESVEKLEDDVDGGGDGGATAVGEPALEGKLSFGGSESGGGGARSSLADDLVVGKDSHGGSGQDKKGQIEVGCPRESVVAIVGSAHSVSGFGSRIFFVSV